MADITTTELFSARSFRDLIIAPLFETSVVLRSGLTRISTDATKAFLPVLGKGTAHWTAELADLVDSAVPSSTLEVVPQKLAAYAVISNEAVADANAASLIGRALVAAVATATDSAFFVGGGTDGPLGLGVATVTAIDAIPTSGTDPYVDAIAAVEAAGGTASVIWMNPLDWAVLAKIKTAAGSSVPALQPLTGAGGALARSLYGVPVITSAGCPVGTAYVADASRVAVVVRTDGTVEADRSAEFSRDGTAVRVVARLEFAFPYAGAVARIKDVA